MEKYLGGVERRLFISSKFVSQNSQKINKNIIFKNEPWQFEIKKWLMDQTLYVVHGCDFIIWEVRADRIGSQEYYHLHGKIKTTLCNMRSCL